MQNNSFEDGGVKGNVWNVKSNPTKYHVKQRRHSAVILDEC